MVGGAFLGESVAAEGSSKPLRPRKLGQLPCEGSLLRGRSPREEPPLTGEVAAEQAGRALDVSGGGKFAVSVAGGGVLDAPRRGQDPSLRCKPLKGCHGRLRAAYMPPLQSSRYRHRGFGGTPEFQNGAGPMGVKNEK